MTRLNRRAFSLASLLGIGAGPALVQQATNTPRPTMAPIGDGLVATAKLSARGRARQAILDKLQSYVIPPPPESFLRYYHARRAAEHQAERALQRTAKNLAPPPNIAALRSVSKQHKALMVEALHQHRYAADVDASRGAEWGLDAIAKAFVTDSFRGDYDSRAAWARAWMENEKLKLGWNDIGDDPADPRADGAGASIGEASRYS